MVSRTANYGLAGEINGNRYIRQCDEMLRNGASVFYAEVGEVGEGSTEATENHPAYTIPVYDAIVVDRTIS